MSEKELDKSEWKDFGLFLLKLALFMFILRTFFLAFFNIPSESMQPRLLIGDYLIVTKWNYGYTKNSVPFELPIIPGRILASEPEAGDVVVFKAPPDNKNDYIKRVIGLPGDIIQMRNGNLEINGVAVQKKRLKDFVIPVTQNMIDNAQNPDNLGHPCYRPEFEEQAKDGSRQCRYPQYRETLPNGVSYNILDVDIGSLGDNIEAKPVPQGHVFVMGDNRDRSQDSRFPAQIGGAVGIVPQENLIGKAWITIFSTDGSANWILPWTWFSAARGDRFGEGF